MFFIFDRTSVLESMKRLTRRITQAMAARNRKKRLPAIVCADLILEAAPSISSKIYLYKASQ